MACPFHRTRHTLSEVRRVDYSHYPLDVVYSMGNTLLTLTSLENHHKAFKTGGHLFDWVPEEEARRLVKVDHLIRVGL